MPLFHHQTLPRHELSAPPETPLAKPVVKAVKQGHKFFFKDFRRFLVRDSVLTLSIGIIVGAAFTRLINAFINDVFNPVISVFINTSNLSTSFFQFQLAGRIITIHYGDLINNLISFFLTALAVFLLIKLMQTVLLNSQERNVPSDKELKIKQLKQIKQTNKLLRQQLALNKQLIAMLQTEHADDAGRHFDSKTKQ